MIAGIFHKGSGLGDQLMRYITVRTIAEEKGFEWGMVHPQNFKGSSFMDVEIHPSILSSNHHRFDEKDIRDSNAVDIRSYDPEINFIEDNTIIDGGFEDSKYWGHNLHNIDKWLKVEPIEVPDDVCVIGFRGGEYATVADLFLPSEYWKEGIERMKQINLDMVFEVHTDDYNLAKALFPEYKVIQNIGINWRSMRYAKHAIIANSAFYIMPRLLRHLPFKTAGYGDLIEAAGKMLSSKQTLTIAPRYWARRNTKTWARPACWYKQFSYV